MRHAADSGTKIGGAITGSTWVWTGSENAGAIVLELKAVVAAPVPASEVEALVRRFEPILYFHKDEKFLATRAAQSIRNGKVFSLALPIDASGPLFHTRPAPLALVPDDRLGPDRRHAVRSDGPHFQWNDDMFQMPLQGSTQWDAFAHVMPPRDTMYNGYWCRAT